MVPQLWILVTGSREITDRGVISAELVDASIGRNANLVVGDARGADALAMLVWQAKGNRNRPQLHRFTADWNRYPRRAGMLRNESMVKFVTAQEGDKVCLAFFQTGATNRGTTHCSNYARNHGIDVREIWVP